MFDKMPKKKRTKKKKIGDKIGGWFLKIKRNY